MSCSRIAYNSLIGEVITSERGIIPASLYPARRRGQISTSNLRAKSNRGAFAGSAISAAAAMVLTKPFSRAVLLRTVRDILPVPTA